MKIRIAKNILVKLLTAQNTIIAKKNDNSHFSKVVMTASLQDQQISLFSTDGELWFENSSQALILQEGQWCFSCYKFYEIIKKLPSGIVVLEEQDNLLAISMLDSSVEQNQRRTMVFHIPLSAPSVYLMPQHYRIHQEHQPMMSMDINLLNQSLSHIKHALSKENTQKNINGICLHLCQNNSLRFVTTDSKRLALYEIFLPETNLIEIHKEATMLFLYQQAREDKKNTVMTSSQSDVSSEYLFARKIILSPKILSFIDHIKGQDFASHKDSRVFLNFYGKPNQNTPTQVEFYVQHNNQKARFFCSLMQGNFPSYDSIIREDIHDKKMIIQSQLLQEAAERVELVLTPQKSTIILTLTKNLLTLTAESEAGTATESIPVEYDCQEEIKLGFSPRYLIDCCQNVKEPLMQWIFSSSDKPILIKPYNPSEEKNSEKNRVLFAVMTMKIAV